MPETLRPSEIRTEAVVSLPDLEPESVAELLVESGKVFAQSLERARAYEAFKEIVAKTMECSGILISSYTKESQTIRCEFAWVGGEHLDHSTFPPIQLATEPGHGMQSEVIRTGEARLFGDVSERVEQGRGRFYDVDPDGTVKDLPKGSTPTTQSALMAPLKVDDGVIGVVQVMAERGGVYSQQHLTLIEGMAVQMATSLKNADLFSKMQTEISERIRIEQVLRDREEEVKQLNEQLEKRVAARTTDLEKATAEMEGFCYSVSHDLRSPIRGISAAAMMLLEDYNEKLDEEGQAHLKSLRTSAAKLGNLIDGLLSFSRLGRAELRPTEIDLSALVERTFRGLQREKYAAATLSVQVGLKAFADEQMLSTAMSLLLGNALKFSGRSETPKIEFGKAGDAYFIKDNGVGFEQEYVGKLFKPFERLHSEHEFPGTGIGLANARRIIERHHGKIWAEGIPGDGATFYFTLGL